LAGAEVVVVELVRVRRPREAWPQWQGALLVLDLHAKRERDRERVREMECE